MTSISYYKIKGPGKLKICVKVALAWRIFTDQSHSVKEISVALVISHAKLYRYLK